MNDIYCCSFTANIFLRVVFSLYFMRSVLRPYFYNYARRTYRIGDTERPDERNCNRARATRRIGKFRFNGEDGRDSIRRLTHDLTVMGVRSDS